jgi:phage shock protein C
MGAMEDRLYRSVDDRMLAGVAGGVAERLDADPSIIRIVWALLIVLTGGVALVAYVVMAVVVPDAPDGGPVPPTGTAPDRAPSPAPNPAPDLTPDPQGTAADPDTPTATTPLMVAVPLATSAMPAVPGPATAQAGGWIAPNGQAVARAEAPPVSRKGRAGSGADIDGDRGALIGGLALILIGVFFLVRQFIPAIDLGAWWPLILIGIGVILLVTSVAAGRRSG